MSLYEVLVVLSKKSASNAGPGAIVSRVRCSLDGIEYVKKSFSFTQLEDGEVLEKDVFREITVLQMLAQFPHVNKLIDIVKNESEVSLILEWCKYGSLQNLEVISEVQLRIICVQMNNVLLHLCTND